MTTVINLLGGPGIGKSVLAAELYAHMKKKGLNVEMVREVAKDYVYDGKKIGPFEQISILGEQIKKESSLFNKVDYIVTDSPVLLGAFYLEYNHKQDLASEFVSNYYRFSRNQGIKFLNYIIPRRGKYQTEGRYESEQDAKCLDSAIRYYLVTEFYTFNPFNKPVSNSKIIKRIMEDLK